MQTDAAVWITARSAILQVALNGASHLCQLASYLMMATCMQLYFQKEIAFAGGYKSVIQYRFLRVWYLTFVSLGCVCLLVTCQPMCQGAALLRWFVGHNGPVGFPYLLMFGKELVQAGRALLVFAKSTTPDTGLSRRCTTPRNTFPGLLYFSFR